MAGPWWAQLEAAVGTSSVVVPCVLGQDAVQVALAEDQHPVGHLGPDGAHEPLRVGVRARAAGRDLHGLDAGAGQDRVEGAGVLPGTVADEGPEACGAVAEVQQEVADLLGRPRALGVRGDPKDMHVAGADLDDEQPVQEPEGDRAVHVWGSKTRPWLLSCGFVLPVADLYAARSYSLISPPSTGWRRILPSLSPGAILVRIFGLGGMRLRARCGRCRL